MKSLYEELGGTYRQVGDYFIPDIELPERCYKIGKYGRMRQRYLKEHRKIQYTTIILNGTLYDHLEETDRICNERMEIMVTSMKKQQGIGKQMGSTKSTVLPGLFYFISCSNSSNSGVEKNSPSVISKPSQSFFSVTAPGFLLSPFKILFTVACGTAEILLMALGVIPRSLHSCLILFAIASLVSIGTLRMIYHYYDKLSRYYALVILH